MKRRHTEARRAAVLGRAQNLVRPRTVATAECSLPSPAPTRGLSCIHAALPKLPLAFAVRPLRVHSARRLKSTNRGWASRLALLLPKLHKLHVVSTTNLTALLSICLLGNLRDELVVTASRLQQESAKLLFTRSCSCTPASTDTYQIHHGSIDDLQERQLT